MAEALAQTEQRTWGEYFSSFFNSTSAAAPKAQPAPQNAPAPATSTTSPQKESLTTSFTSSSTLTAQDKILGALDLSIYEKGRLFLDQDYIREVFKDRGADKTLNALREGFPEHADLLKEIARNPEYKEFKEALHESLVQDHTMMEGLSKITSSPTGAQDMESLKTMLAHPESRANLTHILKNIAEDDNIKFNQLHDLFDASRSGDPAKAKKALMGLGLNEKQADAEVARGVHNKLQEAFRDPSQWASTFGQMLGKLFEALGFPPELTQRLTGFIDMAAKAIAPVTDKLGLTNTSQPAPNVVPEVTTAPPVRDPYAGGMDGMRIAP